MKRLWTWLAGAAAVVGFCILIPIPIWNTRFKDMDGYYLHGSCGDGHGIFAEFERGNWYVTCPGHKNRSLTGELRRVQDHWEAVRSNQTVWVVESAEGHVYFTSSKTGYKFEMERVRNPWRIWIPWILPE
jgi:hypothetical protein